jgi:hypothetical protein
MHALAPLSEPHEWIASTTLWQSGFLPHAASGFAHVLSTHLPQSLSPNAGAGGGDAAAADPPDEPGDAPPPELSGAMSPPPAALPAGALESDGEAELESLALPLLSELLSSAGVSGGLPPPQAIQTGITARRTRDPRERLVWRRMTAVNTCSRAEITEGNAVLHP